MGALTTAACVLALPATLAHEATHYFAARVAGTDDATIAVEVTGAGAVAAWRPIDSRPLEVFAFLAPTVFGSVLAALWLATGVELRAEDRPGPRREPPQPPRRPRARRPAPPRAPAPDRDPAQRPPRAAGRPLAAPLF